MVWHQWTGAGEVEGEVQSRQERKALAELISCSSPLAVPWRPVSDHVSRAQDLEGGQNLRWARQTLEEILHTGKKLHNLSKFDNVIF